MIELRSTQKLELTRHYSMKTFTIEQACLVEDEINRFYYGGADMSLAEDGGIIVSTDLLPIEWCLVKSRVKNAWAKRKEHNKLGETCFEDLHLI